MRPAHYTGDLYKSSRKRLGYLRSLAPSRPSAMTPALDRRVAFATIEAMNCWAGFARALYLSTCRHAYSGAHVRLSTSTFFPNDDDALRFACARFKPHLGGNAAPLTHRDEPNWLDPNTLLILLQDVGASNAGDVGAALSFQGRVLQDLPTFRNFYGHRAHNTVVKAQRRMINYGMSSTLHPTEFCLAYESGRTQSVLVTWLKEMDLVQELMVS